MLAGVTIHNFLLTGFLASLFIIGIKWVAERSGLRGLQDLTKNL